MPPPTDPPRVGAMVWTVSQPPRGPEDRGLATAQEVGNQVRAEVERRPPPRARPRGESKSHSLAVTKVRSLHAANYRKPVCC